MSEFDPGLYRLIARTGSRGGRGFVPGTEVPKTLPKLIEALEKAAGSGRKAAAAAGVPETSWRRWRSGSGKPSGAHQAQLDKARERLRQDVRRKRLAPGREKRLRASPPRLTIAWSFQISSTPETRKRTFPGEFVGQEQWAAMWGRVVDDYLAGGDGAEPVADMVDKAIDEYANDEFEYTAVEIDDTEWHS